MNERVAPESGERTRPRVLFAAPRRKPGRALKRATEPTSNPRPFGKAPNGVREARALPITRAAKHNLRSNRRPTSSGERRL